MDKINEVLTTGQVARICRVAPRTVSKWFDTGQLRGYRIPGSRDRRIPLPQLIRFMKANGMPMNGLESDQARVLVVDDDPDLTGLLERALREAGYEVRIAESAFEAGALAEQFHPTVVLANLDVPGVDGRRWSRFFSARAELQGARLIAVSASLTEADRQLLLQQGFHQTLCKPFTIRQVSALIAAAGELRVASCE